MKKFPLSLKTLALTGGVFLFLSGCTNHFLWQVTNWLADKKEQSLTAWEAEIVDGIPLTESLGPRVAMLMSNFDSVSVEIEESELSIHGEGKGTGGIGSAVPITDDGYFLTAAHNIDGEESLHLIIGLSEDNGRTRAAGVPARMVWTSIAGSAANEEPESGEPMPELDFAIVHADMESLPSFAPFDLAGTVPQEEDPVIGAGWPIVHLKSFRNGARLSAGRILSIQWQEARGTLPEFLVLKHDVPFVIGDSGGPLVDRNGDLVGINAEFRFTYDRPKKLSILVGYRPAKLEYLEYFAVATMPDPEWLWDVIDKDRQERNEASQAFGPRGDG